jgi:16S rRNA (cytosine1402-N4)-methyltransferase
MTGSELVAENSQEHLPVLLQEAVSHLLSGSGASVELSEPSDVFVDATFGRGGHSREILKQLTPNSRLIGLDRDPEAVVQGAVLAAQDQRFSIHQARFSELSQVLDELKIGSVQGILMDIGVSSPQLDNAERGFSFAADGPLDMRMNPTEGQSAADWLNSAEEADIAQVLWMYGEEKNARRIAKAIAAARPMHTTLELADAVSQASPKSRGPQRKHPATRTFQAVRIFVNEETTELERGLEQGFQSLALGGRLAVISFHSLEDRKVKHTFRQLSQPPKMPRRLPLRHVDALVPGRLVCPPIKAALAEQTANPRSRSATLRVIERVLISD